jgi:sulfonate transport system substrate-binding protein
LSRSGHPHSIVVATIALAAVAAIGGCGVDVAPTSSSELLRVGYSTRTPLHAAVGEVFAHTEILQGHGFTPELVPFVRGKDQHEHCAAGRIDATFSCEVPALVHLERLPEMRLAGSAGELGDIALVVPQGSSIRSVNDLRDRRVALVGGASADLALDGWLRDADLRRQLDVWVDGHGGQGETAIDALGRGAADAVVIWDPWLTAAVQQHDLRVVESTPFWSVVAVFDGHPSVADAGPYLLALGEALTYIAEHPEQVAGWVAPTVGVSEATVLAVLAKNRHVGGEAPAGLTISEPVMERLKACERHARATGEVSPAFRIADRLRGAP